MNRRGVHVQVGDIVDVHFTTGDVVYDAEVLYTPQDVGDSWMLRDGDGSEHAVCLFARMTVRQRAEDRDT